MKFNHAVMRPGATREEKLAELDRLRDEYFAPLASSVKPEPAAAEPSAATSIATPCRRTRRTTVH